MLLCLSRSINFKTTVLHLQKTTQAKPPYKFPLQHAHTHTHSNAQQEPLETITMSAFKPRLQRKIQGISGIKTSYFPPQSPFIDATNPDLLNTGAVSKKARILSKVTNHFTVGI